MSAACRIAVLAKAPLAGYAKTRLIPALGAAGAAALAERLLEHAVTQAVVAGLGPVALWAAPDPTHPVFARLGAGYGLDLLPQGDGDLGERIARVFESTWAAAAGPLLLMGSDAPALDAALLRQAAAALQEHDAVFVPAFDGGYALIGLRAWAPRLRCLFDGMTWSTAQVMAETRERLAAAGLRHAELPAVSDIDEEADLVHLPLAWRVGAAVTMPHRTRSLSAMSELPDPAEHPAPAGAPEAAALEAAPEVAPAAVSDAAQPEAAAAADVAPPAAPDLPGDTVSAAAAASEAPTAPDAAPAPAAVADLSPAACAARLAELFPALFGAGRALPIKLRIQNDIQQRAPGLFTRKSLSPFLHRYTTSTAYLKALVNLPHRFDLDGAPAGDIDDVHRQAAATELERRRGLFEARRAAERAVANEARRAAEAAARQQHAAEDQARRDRAALLRAFESSTLTRANFCALKGIAEADLDGQLHQAWLEREQRAQEMRPVGERPVAAAGPRAEGPGAEGPRAAAPRADGRPPRRRGAPGHKPSTKPPARPAR